MEAITDLAVRIAKLKEDLDAAEQVAHGTYQLVEDAGVAQPEEHLIRNQQVAGSTPAAGSIEEGSGSSTVEQPPVERQAAGSTPVQTAIIPSAWTKPTQKPKPIVKIDPKEPLVPNAAIPRALDMAYEIRCDTIFARTLKLLAGRPFSMRDLMIALAVPMDKIQGVFERAQANGIRIVNGNGVYRLESRVEGLVAQDA